MSQSYRAFLHGDRLEWRDDPPGIEETVPVIVTLSVEREELSDAERGRRMAEALRQLAKGGAFSYIEDPVEWQREIRRDRPLPGRGE